MLVPAEVRELARRHLAMMDGAAPGLLSGLYLTGFVALNDFGLSVDFVAVLPRLPTYSDLVALTTRIGQVETAAEHSPRWADAEARWLGLDSSPVNRDPRVLGVAVIALLVVTVTWVRGADGPGPDRTAAPAFVAEPPPPVDVPTPQPTSPPSYEGVVSPIDAATAARMSASWRPGCPVGLEALRLLSLTYWDQNGGVQQGELVVHADQAAGVRSVFESLFRSRFPIASLRLVDEFGGDDDASMAANNTSGFNCRRVGVSRRWSEHAFGRAVDINPLQNPYVTRRGAVLPPAGRPFADRTRPEPGLVLAGGPAVSAFGAIGWRWGGAWRSGPDYQHFSSTGR